MFRQRSLLVTTCSIMIASAVGLGIAIAAAAQPQSPGQTPAPATPQSYVGTNQCFMCHRNQANAFSETNHAHAFTHLAEKYRNDTACLKCHVTGFGKPNGYTVGTEKDLLMVGCESCHGPGARHIDAAQRFILADPGEEAKIEQEIRDTITKTPSDTVCITCHVTQAHGRHPPYDDTLPVPNSPAAATHSARRHSLANRLISSTRPFRYVPGYSVKTCGSCHYDHYRHWRAETHSLLSANLSTKYANDLGCQKCHVKADAVISASAAGTGEHPDYIGIACESCHGPAFEHVRFNLRYIHGPPLTPKLEQVARASIRNEKPVATCIQCHVEQGHKEHPPFDAEKNRLLQ